MLEINERYYLICSWKLHNMSLPKEVAKVRRGPSHYLETNCVVYSISDVIRKNIFACYP